MGSVGMSNKLERRKYVRLAFPAMVSAGRDSACKVRLMGPGGATFVAGRLIDIAEGGVGFEVKPTSGARTLRVGDVVEVGVDWTGRTLLPASSLIPGQVVRIEDGIDGQLIGVKFDRQTAFTAAKSKMAA